MKLVEKHIINKNHKFYKECDKLCFSSKNLYNFSLYAIRQHFFKTKEYLNNTKLYHIVKTGIDYKNLPAKVSNQTLRVLDRNFKSFFASIKKKDDRKKRIPGYLHKTEGRFITIYERGAVSKRVFKKENKIKLSKSNIEFTTSISDYDNICEVRIVPRRGYYIIEVVYKTIKVEIKKDNKRTAGIDIGLNNLVALVFNTGDIPQLINGRPLKSINQYFNKVISGEKSRLSKENGVKTSNRIKRVNLKRTNKINDYLHKTSRYIVNQLVSKNITKLVIGKNKEWKQDINIGKRNNQNFVNIPHARLIDILIYKCNLVGIDIILQEESYTSNTSFLDNEEIKRHEVYKGKRIKRGLFRSSGGKIINADVNGACNILRKAIPNIIFMDGIEALAVMPIKVSLSGCSKVIQ